MARPREFDVDTALNGAMDVFWEHGYESASLPLLLEGMALTRGSLYKAFSGKKTLFINVLERYEKEAVAPAVDLLNNRDIEGGIDRIDQVFKHVVDVVRNGDHRGCLLCSALVGPASEDDEIASIVHQLLGEMQHGFEAALEQSEHPAKSNKKIRRELADLLLTQYVGLRVLARSRAPLDVLERSTASLMRVLESR